MQRQVEAALAGVALAAGTTAQLVVDAARLVPLGAEHVEPAGVEDLRRPRPATSALTASNTSSHAASYSSGVSTGLRPSSCICGDGEELGVAAEHDVGAAAGHVGGDGDGADAAGLGDDRGLTGVVLRVQHLVRTPFLASSRERYSLFSTLVVPTSTGWPVRVALDDVLDDLRRT